MPNVKIRRTQQEKPRPKKGRLSYAWVTAWSVVNADTGQDIFQPYFDTKAKARSIATAAGYTVVHEDP